MIPVVFVAICAFLIIVPCYVAPLEVGMGLGITLLGVPVYYFGVEWKNKPKWMQNSIGKSTLYIYIFRYKINEKSIFHKKDP